MLLIYAKHKTDRKFMPLDLAGGKQVTSLFRASAWEVDRRDELGKHVAELNADNPEWIFEIRNKK